MAEITFNIDEYGVITFRLEPTDIRGFGTASAPLLNLLFKVRMASIPKKPPVDYTVIRLSVRVAVAHPNEEQLTTFEAPPLA